MEQFHTALQDEVYPKFKFYDKDLAVVQVNNLSDDDVVLREGYMWDKIMTLRKLTGSAALRNVPRELED